MAQLFETRRLQVDELLAQPFDPGVQLPLVAELDLPRRRRLAIADLGNLLGEVASGVSPGAVTAADAAGPFDEAAFRAAVLGLHQAILDALVESEQQTSAYQLGLTLSDTCWLPTVAGGPQPFLDMFQRRHVAALKNWLASAGNAIPPGTAGIVGHSLENWQDWIEANARGITGSWTANGQAEQIIKALRIQARAWHSVLADGPQAGGAPTINAWIQVSSSVVRATRQVTMSVLQHFWWALLIVVAVIAGILFLVIDTLHGGSRIWTSLIWVGGSLGGTSLGLRSAISRAVTGARSEVWDAAQADAAAWSVTWLPALKQTVSQRRSLAAAGVAMPRMRAKLESAAQPARKA